MSAACQFPEGDPHSPDYQTCGAPVARFGLPYCARHMKVAYRAKLYPSRPKSFVAPSSQVEWDKENTRSS
jgi:hypothetical protein